jgi:hypothetical protein
LDARKELCRVLCNVAAADFPLASPRIVGRG